MESLRPLAGAAALVYRVDVDGRPSDIELLTDGTLRLDGRPVEVDIADTPNLSVYSVLIDGASHEVYVEHSDGAYLALVRGRMHQVRILSDAARGTTTTSVEPPGARCVCAPLCGLVVDVAVAEGDLVSEGQTLVVVESMKMEMQIRAERAGRVSRINVKPGEVVREREVLALVD